MPPPTWSMVLVNRQPLIRMAMRLLIDTQPDLRILAELGCAKDLNEIVCRLSPDVVVLDFRIEDVSKARLREWIQQWLPASRTVVFGGSATEEDIYQALQCGARCFLSDDTDGYRIVDAIRQVIAGKRVIPPDIAALYVRRMQRSSLTPRELEVLQLLIRGLSDDAIAACLGVSEGTARNHMRQAYRKLSAKGRLQAVLAALSRGISSIEEIRAGE